MRRIDPDDPEYRRPPPTGELGPLFEAPPPVHRRPTDTEVAAAERVSPTVDTLRRTVLGLIDTAGAAGLTADEAIQATGILDYSIRPRFTELRRAGVIRDSGTRRPNRRDNPEVVWIVA